MSICVYTTYAKERTADTVTHIGILTFALVPVWHIDFCISASLLPTCLPTDMGVQAK